jgi:hypothetical protein
MPRFAFRELEFVSNKGPLRKLICGHEIERVLCKTNVALTSLLVNMTECSQ